MSLKLGKYHFKFRHGWLYIYVEVPPEEDEALIAQHLQTLEKNPDDITTRFILGNVLRMKGQINKARVEYERVAQAKDSGWSPQAIQILAQIEGKSDSPPPISMKYFYHMQIVPEPARTWRHMKLGIKRRLKRHKFITSPVSDADIMASNEDKQNLFYLKCEGVLLGLLKLDHTDFPWAFCHFQPTSAFNDVKARFDEEGHILAACRRVAPSCHFGAENTHSNRQERQEREVERVFLAIFACFAVKIRYGPGSPTAC